MTASIVRCGRRFWRGLTVPASDAVGNGTEMMVEVSVRTRIAEAMARARPEVAITEVRRLHGGVSSLTYAATVRTTNGPAEMVLKIAPPGLPAVRNRDVLRQARLLHTLQSRALIPLPKILFQDSGEPPLFGMEFLNGQAYEPQTEDIDDPPSPAVVERRARVAAATLAHLHAATPSELGIADEMVVRMGVELRRWDTLYDSISSQPLRSFPRLRDDLYARLPADVDPVLVHGDYRVANMIFDGPILRGIIDWEIWSVGDPRIDLAWLLMNAAPTHRFYEERSPANIAAGQGMPSPSELLGEYRAAGGRAYDDMDWFAAFSLFKTAATMAAITARELRKKNPDPTLVVAAASLPDVVERGLTVLHDGIASATP